MIARIVTWAVEKRWLVILLTVVAAIIGASALSRLPIDAVPDITNNQIQINVRAPALSPELVEKQVAFPIETALAGIPGLDHTRSLSRNGFAQVTAVFDDTTDIYFARSQVAERLNGAAENLPAGVQPEPVTSRSLPQAISSASGWAQAAAPQAPWAGAAASATTVSRGLAIRVSPATVPTEGASDAAASSSWARAAATRSTKARMGRARALTKPKTVGSPAVLAE